MTLTFEEAVFGTEKISQFVKMLNVIHVMVMVLNLALRKTCTYCNGQGHVTVEQNTILGRMQTQKVCPECEGSGQVFEEKCSDCHGKGTQNKKLQSK